VVDGFDADIGVARGREQFKLMGLQDGVPTSKTPF
jgi:hypothetical protein